MAETAAMSAEKTSTEKPSQSLQPSIDVESDSSQPSEEDSQDDKPPRDIHGFRWIFAISAALSSVFLFSLDNTVVADVQPVIVSVLGEIGKLPWLGAAFSLGAVAILPWGRAYGVFSVKWLFIANILLFEVGSTICGAAPTMNSMIVGRAIAGVGGSGMYVGCLTYIAALTSNKERPIYMGILGMVWGLGTILGPVVGGAFTESSATWRWAFYINLVVGAIFSPGYFWALPNVDFQRGAPLSDKLKQVDWLGMVLFLSAMVSFTMAINFGGSLYPWNSAREIALWVVCGVLFIVFGLTQRYVPFVAKKNRLYPAHFIFKPLMLNLQIQMFLLSGVMLGSAYYIPLYFQFARGDSALQAAVRLLPYICMTVTFSLFNGTLMSKLGYYIPWYLFAGVTIVTGTALMYTVNLATSESKVYGYSALIGMGVGSAVQAGFPVAQVVVPPEEISNAIGFIAVAQSTGITVFYAVAGSIYLNLAVANVAPVLAGTSHSIGEIQELAAGTTSAAFQTLESYLRDAVIDGIVEASRNVWILFLVGGSVCLILSLFLGRDKPFH